MELLTVLAIALTGAGDAATGFDAFQETFFPGAACAWDSPRAQRYLAVFDAQVDGLKEGFDFERGLRDMTGAMPPADVADLDRNGRKAYAGMSEYVWLYRLGRSSSSDIGCFALAWALPASKHFGDEGLWRGVVNGLEAYVASEASSGEFVFSSIRYSSCYGTHEMAWRLEPLLAAYLCVRHTLEPEQERRIREGLERAADFLHDTPWDSQSNRGCVWCGVTATAAKVLDRPDYLPRVQEVWDWVGRRVFNETGQVVEGPGPDFSYSHISLVYTFHQRRMRDWDALDGPLTKALDWFTTMHDRGGVPLQSVATRMSGISTHPLTYLLGPLEYYAQSRPYYSVIADGYLADLERDGTAGATDHGGGPWLAAAAYHDPSIEPAPLPVQLCRFSDYYYFDATKYITIRRDYQTLLLLMGTMDLTGLQHWAVGGDRPVICQFDGGSSGVKAWGLDTARVRLKKGFRRDTSDLETVTVDWGNVRTCYVFGESATWVINAAPGVEREVRWAINRDICASPALDGAAVQFEEQRSGFDLGPVAPNMRDLDRGMVGRGGPAGIGTG